MKDYLQIKRHGHVPEGVKKNGQSQGFAGGKDITVGYTKKQDGKRINGKRDSHQIKPGEHDRYMKKKKKKAGEASRPELVFGDRKKPLVKITSSQNFLPD